MLKAAEGPLASRPGIVLLLTSPPDFSGGAGGWEAMDRPRRRPARWWRGGVERTQSIAGLLDPLGLNRRFEDGSTVTGTVEAALDHLERLGVTPGGADHPTPVRLHGDLSDPYSRRGGLWVVQGLSLGDRVYAPDGTLRRQAVTVELVDYEEAPSIRPVTVRRTRANVNKPRTRRVTTRKGDTLRLIAVRELGFAGGWQRIRDWNPKQLKGTRPVGPDDPLRAGVRLVLK